MGVEIIDLDAFSDEVAALLSLEGRSNVIDDGCAVAVAQQLLGMDLLSLDFPANFAFPATADDVANALKIFDAGAEEEAFAGDAAGAVAKSPAVPVASVFCLPTREAPAMVG